MTLRGPHVIHHTGASRGIGLAIACAEARGDGANIVSHAKTDKPTFSEAVGHHSFHRRRGDLQVPVGNALPDCRRTCGGSRAQWKKRDQSRLWRTSAGMNHRQHASAIQRTPGRLIPGDMRRFDLMHQIKHARPLFMVSKYAIPHLDKSGLIPTILMNSAAT